MKWKILKWNSGVLAIIALLLSIKSLYDLTLNFSGCPKVSVCGQRYGEGFFSVASFLGFVLGYLALKSATKRLLDLLAMQYSNNGNRDRRPDITHRDNWIAVFAMCLAMPAIVLTLSSLPYFIPDKGHHLGRETASLQVLRTIHNNQSQLQAMKGRYGTLKDMADAGLIEELFVKGEPISGYRYSFSDVTERTYCAHADRVNAKCGDRDFIICEDGDFRYIESTTIGTVIRGEGVLLGGQRIESSSPTPAP